MMREESDLLNAECMSAVSFLSFLRPGGLPS